MATPTLDDTTLDRLISAAVAAPSIHNSQPWCYRLDPATLTVEVHAAPERRVPHADPDGRALHLSVGAALFNLRVAVAHFGWEPVVRLLPHAPDPGHLASVRLAGPRRGDGRTAANRANARLYEALWRRHSNRFPFSDRPVPEDLLRELATTAGDEGVRLVLPDPAEAARLLELTARADWYESADPRRREESRSWVRDGAADGVPSSAIGPRDEQGRMPVRDFSAAPPVRRPPPGPFETHPVVGVLSTRQDEPADWLRAGQGLEHVLLLATAHDLRASLLHQALEWRELRWALNDPHGGIGHVQMLMRLGYGPQSPPTSRRPARDVLAPPRPPGS
ncbi:Acg family FMN-binding oxidoreductase [Actinacidiphila sp. bgisy144]|uniref:Acg family FMN-binding oxidoreductase n=1 Tax=Actinacidiphila sp. bgisy144 TaxID=3413791 RepID=UPI003EBA4E8A